MRRLFWLCFMLLLAGCGSGGGYIETGGSNGNTPPDVSVPGSTGSITLKFVEAPKYPLMKAAALEPASAGRARIVLKSSRLNFRKVVDVPFGTTLEPIALPVATDYMIEAVFYAKGTPNLLTRHGITAAPINVPSGGVTVVELPMADIEVALSPPTEIYSGTTYTVPEPNPSILAYHGLIQRWSLATSTSPFAARSHMVQSPGTSHANIASPVVSQPGQIHFQGEFFMKEDLLDNGESSYDWSYVTEPAPSTLALATLNIQPTALPPDTKDPEVRSFTVPVGKVPTELIAPISIVGADNAGVVAYLITQTNAQPAQDHPRWSATMPTSYTYSGTLLSGVDNLVHLYAWVKDPSGRISPLVTGVSEKVVVLNDSPVVNSFTVPISTQFGTTGIPVTITGTSYNNTELEFLVTETATKPAAAAGWLKKPAGEPAFAGSYDVQSIVQISGTTHTVPLYAWVKDGIAISEYARGTVTISDVPQVTTFTAPSTVTTGTILSGIALAGRAAPGRSISGYHLSTSSAKPHASAFTATAPTSYTFTDVVSGAPTYKMVYAWVIDSAGYISKGKGISVRLAAP